MKPSTFCIWTAILAVTQVFAQDHIAPCNGPGDHTEGICYGYATGRAAEKSAGDPVCDPLTFYQPTINTGFFTFNNDPSLAGLEDADIVRFSDHVAYVVSVANPMDSTLVAQYSTLRHREEYKKLYYVKAEFGAWTGYYERKEINVTVQNSFSDGDVIVNGSRGSAGSWSIEWWDHQTLEAVNRQDIGGYVRVYQYWITPNGNKDPISISIIPKPSQTYTANFKKEYNITFQNNFIGVGNAGIMKVNDTQYTLPRSAFPVVQDQSISAEAISGQTYNSIIYTFTNWTKDGNVVSTSAQTDFTPNDHTTYTANFTGKPKPMSDYNLQLTSDPGEYISFSWDEHGNGNVQYKIWRRVKPQGGSIGPETLMATLNHNVTSWTDYEYILTSGYTVDLLEYDVRAYYTVEGSSANLDYITVFGEGGIILKAAAAINEWAYYSLSSPAGYKLSVFPNPVNPATNFNYQLVEDGSVTLAIYDMKGRLVKTLAQGEKQSGYYGIRWNGVDETNSKVASGVYFYQFMAQPLSGKEPFRKSGKLLLTK